MKKFIGNSYLIIILVLGASFVRAQEANSEKEKITNALSNYFALERENFHLHFDKTTFFTTEEVWFKGYVFNRKNNIPYFSTTNVYILLIDEEGNKIDSQLLFSYNGTFSGSFKLNRKYKTGKYYLQVYTNWANNFKEDESAVFKINIINENDGTAKPVNTVNYSKINIDFHPEGGTIIEGTTNTIGVKLSDCNGNPIPVKNGEIVNAKGEVIKTFSINQFGYGKFNLEATAETYKAIFTINDKKTEAILPKTSPTGIALEVNDYAISGKTVAILRTNSRTLSTIDKKTFFLVIQQDDKASIFDINFSNQQLKQELIFSNFYLFDGTNTIRILDSDLNQIAERVVFKYPSISLKNTLEVTNGTNGQLKFLGKLSTTNANLSVTILPGNSIANDDINDIYASFWINPYVTENIRNAKYYFNDISKSKPYELDLFFLNQVSKYNWTDIIHNPPKKNYEFDLGLNIKGTVNQVISDKTKYNVRLYSLFANIDAFSKIDSKNQFEFNNIIAQDSSDIAVTLVKMPGTGVNDLKYYAKITNGKINFNKEFNPKFLFCDSKNMKESTAEYEIPKFQSDVIMLKEVIAEKSKLTHENTNGNSSLQGYKVTDTENNNLDVLDFIRGKGFIVNKNTSQVSIIGYVRTSIRGGSTSPVVYIDGRKLMDFEELWGMRMDELDEIYISRNAIVPGITNNAGIIRMYTKKGGKGQRLDKSVPFLINSGFEKIKPYKNTNYLATWGNGYDNFGIINWIPQIIPEDNGEYDFVVPNLGQRKIKILMEGYTIDGKLISETKTINIE